MWERRSATAVPVVTSVSSSDARGVRVVAVIGMARACPPAAGGSPPSAPLERRASRVGRRAMKGRYLRQRWTVLSVHVSVCERQREVHSIYIVPLMAAMQLRPAIPIANALLDHQVRKFCRRETILTNRPLRVAPDHTPSRPSASNSVSGLCGVWCDTTMGGE